MHRTWVEVSCDALRKNITSFKALLAPQVTLAAVVKANAYGHGLTGVVEVCVNEGITHFAVDAIDEAEQVRIAAPGATIFLLGAQSVDAYERIVRAQAIQTVSRAEDVRLLAEAARRVGKPVQITCEIETGLHRLGASERAVRAVGDEVRAHAGWVYLQSIASHFASSEDASAEWETKRQNNIFCDAITYFAKINIFPPYQHISCSAATLLEPTMQHTLVRAGIMLYGLWPSSDTKRQGTFSRRHAVLSPVLQWKTTLVHIQDVAPGEGIGYGASFRTNRPMRIGVLPVGYYDGLDRRSGNKGFVIVRGTRCPIVGRICMNMCMIDIGGAPTNTKVGDVVSLIGRDNLAVITADDWAEIWGTIHYEVVTRIAAHIPRVLV